MSTRVSGLSDEHAAHARALICKQAAVMVANKGIIHYTQSAERNQGLADKLTITKGQYPLKGDCSSTAEWMLWDAIGRDYGCKSPFGDRWMSSYTGSQYKCGKRVVHDKNLKVGDFVFYGDQGGGIPEHVAVYIGGGKVFSHGGEAGPFILDLDYRKDRRKECMRRFI